MSFDSLWFPLFLVVTFAVYWAVPMSWQWLVIFVSSMVFYMSWKPVYILLLLFDALVSFLFAILIEKENERASKEDEASGRKKILLAVPVLMCFGVLVVFKYLNFGIDTINGLLGFFDSGIRYHTFENIILPVGISFYSFQIVGYLTDVYRGDTRAERHIGKYMAFILFFPQLVAGPIERSRNLLPQIKSKHIFSYVEGASGLRLMMWGYFKKLVVANTLAGYVDMVYGDLKSYTGFSLALVALFFSLQIYCDFSGYSDIARGTARMFGIRLMENFRCPYFADSIRDFWSRWHISLSTWFRDYVYIPLGGNRKDHLRRDLNLLATFLTSGLWHGASWTFVAWGGITEP